MKKMLVAWLLVTVFLAVCTCSLAESSALEAKYPVGSNVILGRCDQDGDESNGLEPIEWTILEIQGNNALVISRMALACRSYDESGYFSHDAASWNESQIRNYLKHFTVKAFADEELACLVPCKHGDVTDVMFLLSRAEVEELLPIEAFRVCNATETAVQQALEIQEGYRNVLDMPLGYHWWLRDTSPKDAYDAAVVTDMGDFDERKKEGFSYCGFHTFVRPAICIDLSMGIARPVE